MCGLTRWMLRNLTACGLLISMAVPGAAQGTRPSRPSTAIRSLESKAQEAQTAYLSQLGELAQGYEDSGNMEQAQETLRQILKLKPDDEQVKTKLKELQEKVFLDNQQEIEIDSTKGWVSTGLKVTKGQPVRIQATGTYKFIVNTEIGPEGFATQDIARDMGNGIAAGALMGTVFAESTQRGRPPQPTGLMQIGREAEFKPDADGVLFLRLNVPAASKCIGKVKVMVTGNIAGAAGGGNR